MLMDPAKRAVLAAAALKVAAEKPWREATLFDLARAAGEPVEAFYAATLADAVDCVEEQFDRAVGAGMTAVDASQSLRDRLFDLLMTRFEAMEPHRAAVLSMEPGRADPVAVAAQHHRHVRLAQWVMGLAGIDGEGVAGKARAQGLAVIVAQARAAWRQDSAGDFARTMGALDKALRRAEETFGRFAGFETAARPGSADEASPAGRPAGSAPG